MKIKATIVAIICGLTPILTGALSKTVYANSEFSVTPMHQKIVLTPGERYEGTFNIANPASNTNIFNYKLNVEPFYVDNSDEVVFENNGDYNQIVNWTTLDKETGSVEPNKTATAKFIINVPPDAPAGGQYVMIRTSSNDDLMPVSNSLNIQNVLSIAHLIYAEVTGETTRSGEILSADVPAFLLDGNIIGASAIKNTGNVHSDAKYTLQVFPLFSNEEIYTNEEKPRTRIILPDRTLYNELAWEDTPAIGIFNVIYTVEFEGITTQVSKLVIKCPIWLLFIIIFAIFALIFYFVAKSKARKKATKASQTR